MEKEPRKQRSLCACCQFFWQEIKERNLENKYLKQTKNSLDINMNIVSNVGQMFFFFVDSFFSNSMTLALFYCCRQQHFWA